MSGVGPELPPHLLAKRKRQLEESEQIEAERPSGAKRHKSPPAEQKPSRVLGPAPPPAPLDERPTAPRQGSEDSSSDDDDDDDFGPSLPSASQSKGGETQDIAIISAPQLAPDETQSSSSRARRDEWMMVPPKQDDLSARMDPTKLRAKGFNTGKSARGPPGAGTESAIWTETPEQKRKRLEDEVMGRSAPDVTGKGSRAQQSRSPDPATAAKIREHTEKTRGSSLYDRHQKKVDREKEDDPSARAFDREKDIGGGMKIGNAQRKEMLSKAANFSSKFSSGSYL